MMKTESISAQNRESLRQLRRRLVREQRAVSIRKFFRNKLSVVGMVLVLLMLICAVFAPLITGLLGVDPYTATMQERFQAPSAAHLFGTDNINMLTDIETDFDSENASFTQAANAVNTAYETSAQPGDIRAGRYWKNKTYGNGATTHVFCKYIGNEQTDSDYRVPLLRYAEMYLILIEDLPLAEAQTYFETYRLARGLSETMANSMFATESSRLAQLEKEWRKEFWGEGQMFAFYKKHHYTAFTWPSNVSLPENALIVPMPKGITNFE